MEAALTEAVAVTRRLVVVDPENRFLLDTRLRRLARHLSSTGKRREAVDCLRECERLWPKDGDGLRGVARGFRELADELRPWWTELSPGGQGERQLYLEEAVRLEKAASALRP